MLFPLSYIRFQFPEIVGWLKLGSSGSTYGDHLRSSGKPAPIGSGRGRPGQCQCTAERVCFSPSLTRVQATTQLFCEVFFLRFVWFVRVSWVIYLFFFLFRSCCALCLCRSVCDICVTVRLIGLAKFCSVFFAVVYLDCALLKSSVEFSASLVPFFVEMLMLHFSL